MQSDLVVVSMAVLAVLVCGGGCDGGTVGPGTKVVTVREELPAWQPGTNTVAYSAGRSEQDGPGVYVVDVVSGVRSRVIANGTAAAWSRDGSMLAFQDAQGVGIVDIVTGSARRVPSAGDASRVTWSPDGTWLACEMRGSEERIGIWKLRADGQASPERITPIGMRGGMADWSASINEIVFSSPGEGGGGDLFAIEPNGANLRQLTATKDKDEVYPRWSPDGSEIAYATMDGLWVLDLLGGRSRQLSGTEEAHLSSWQSGSWSGDGERIVYHKVRLWVIDANGRNNRALQ